MAQTLVHLLPYQRKWLADKSRFKIAMVSRQCGKTKYMGALEVIEDCLEAESRRDRTRWIWLSRGERQAVEAMEEGLKPFCKIYGAAFEALEYEWSDGDGPRYRASEIVFPHGTRITALPANPDTARGFTANVVLDEFAFHQDSRKIWSALFPVISRPGLKLRILSTPNGKSNKFYELMTGDDKVWSRHTIDIYQAVADGLDRNIDELRSGAGDQDTWEQEYELKWLDEASSWLPFELITSAEHDDAGDVMKYAGGNCFAGNDIAIRGDLWVFWVWEPIGDVLWTRDVCVLRRASFAEQDAAMHERMDRFKIVRCAMDQTGMGEKPVEDARRRYPGRIEGVVFNPTTRLAVATIGKQAFEDRKVRIPSGNLELRADLHKPKKIVGPTGIPRIVAEADTAGHADRFWAAMLGLSAADNSKYPPADFFVPRGAGDDDDDVIDEGEEFQRRLRERELKTWNRGENLRRESLYRASQY